MSTKEAMTVLRKALEDPEYRIGWQANIAMSIYDAYRKELESSENPRDLNMRKICNDGASNFLDLLTMECDN